MIIVFKKFPGGQQPAPRAIEDRLLAVGKIKGMGRFQYRFFFMMDNECLRTGRQMIQDLEQNGVCPFKGGRLRNQWEEGFIAPKIFHTASLAGGQDERGRVYIFFIPVTVFVLTCRHHIDKIKP